MLMAGLLPKLQRGALPGSAKWIYLEPMMPGKHPIEALALALKSYFPDSSIKTLREDLEDDAARGLHLLATQLVKKSDTKVVLLVDQFEELFTQTESEAERRQFIELLLTAATEPCGPVLVLLTLRADFYDRPMQYPALSPLIQANQRQALPMEVEDLRATIEQPAAQPDVRLTFEGNLVGDLLFEVQGQAGALPLLQFTLDQLFQRRSGHRLTLQAYREIGGVKGALSQHAERTYAALPSEEHRKMARALFLRLIEPGATEQDITRRRAVLSEFSFADPEQTCLMRETIDAFITARLVTTNEIAAITTIEVSHEAVIREWGRLVNWLQVAREDIRLQEAISKDVEVWKQHGKPKDRLYRGTELAEARAWMKREAPSKDEMDFLEASTRQERNVRHRQRFLFALISVVLIGGLVGALVLQTAFLRTLPVSVLNWNDGGPNSLREAIQKAEPGSTITFATNLEGTITLTSGELEITKNLTISGPPCDLTTGACKITISGQKKQRIFYVHNVATVTISNLAIKDGFRPCATGGGCDTSGGRGLGFGGDGDQRVGGAIFNGRGTTLNLTNIVVSESTAGYGIIFNNGTLTLANCTVSNNKESGIFNINTLSVINSTISDNNASYGAGINNWGNLTLISSTISGNTASGNGGGIYNRGYASLSNSTISGNRANIGGGIYDDPRSSMEIDYSTIYQNEAKTRGGGIASQDFNDPFILMQATIVGGDSARQGPDIDRSVLLAFPNLIQDTSDSRVYYDCQNGQDHSPACKLSHQSIFGKPPMLGPLQNNGGLTKTHALLPGSPALDQIPPDRSNSRTFYSSICDNTDNNFDSSRDQRGVKRPQGLACDIGAYEAQD